jgi:hypothetical protein
LGIVLGFRFTIAVHDVLHILDRFGRWRRLNSERDYGGRRSSTFRYMDGRERGITTATRGWLLYHMTEGCGKWWRDYGVRSGFQRSISLANAIVLE